MSSTLPKLMSPLSMIVWLDLSFNALSTIDSQLTQFPNLKVLYLHANKIHHLSQLDTLAHLPKLRNLTLHGNPVELVKGYRHHVLAFCSGLKHLDFSAITKQDRRDSKRAKGGIRTRDE